MRWRQCAARRRCSDGEPRRGSALGGFETGLQAVMEWRVGDDHVEATIDLGEDVAGKHIASRPLAASVARLASTAGALTSHRVRRTFGEWLASAAASTPAPQPTSSTFPLVCGSRVESSSWLPTSRPSRLKTPGRVLIVRLSSVYSPQNASASKVGCFPDGHDRGHSGGRYPLCLMARIQPASAPRCGRRCGFHRRRKCRFPPAAESRFISWNCASGLFFGQ